MRSILLLLLVGGGTIYVDGASTGNTGVVDKGADNLNSLAFNQTTIIKEFREENAALLTDNYLRSDAHIIGLLRANKLNKEKATKHLKEILSWRSKNQIEKLGEEPYNPKMQKLFPFRVETFTKDGCPVLELDWGKWSMSDYYLSESFLRDAIKDLTRHSRQVWEKTRRAVKNSPCDQAVFLIDIDGFSMKNIAQPNSINTVIDMCLTVDGKYPNLYKTIVETRANSDFSSFLKFAKQYLGPTGAIMEVFTDAEAEQAKQYIDSFNVDRSTLSKAYYGTKG